MPNKYELRRRAIKEAKGRSDNPFASPRQGGKVQSGGYSPPPMDRIGLTWVLCLALALLTVAVYVQTARHKFTVCDDNVYIYENPRIVTGLTWEHVKWAFADSHEGNWHPLTWISHMLDWQLFGLGSWEPENLRYKTSWPGGHHLVNMVIHGTNAVLLFLALRLLTGTLWPSFVVAALFGIHPLRVESVAWAAERKDVLCGLFWMASMLAYALYTRRRPLMQSSPPEVGGTLGLYALVVLFFGMALLAKAMAITLPCVLLLLDAWPLGRWRRALWPPGNRGGPDFVNGAWLVLEKVPLFALVAYDWLQTVVGQDKGVALNSWEALPPAPRMLNCLMSVANYLGQMFWPAGLAPFYPHPYMIKNGWGGFTAVNYCEVAIGGVILVTVTAAVIVFWRRGYLAVGWFWFLGTLTPVIGLPYQAGTQARADRYTYLPMIGICLMVAWLLKEAADRWPRSRRSMAAGAVVVFAVLSAITFKQVSYWIDSYVLFEHAAEVTDNNWFAYNHIGIAYDSDAKKMFAIDAAAAKALFDELAENFKAPPRHLDDSLKSVLPAAGSIDDFKAAAQEAESRPEAAVVVRLLGRCLRDDAADQARLRFRQQQPGRLLCSQDGPKDLALAEKYFRGRLMSNPRYADAFNNLGIILAREEKFDEAIMSHIAGFARAQRQGLGPQQSLPRVPAEARPASEERQSRKGQAGPDQRPAGEPRFPAMRSELFGRVDHPLRDPTRAKGPCRGLPLCLADGDHRRQVAGNCPCRTEFREPLPRQPSSRRGD